MPGYLNEQKRDIQPNNDLSDLDKAFIMLNYPGRVDKDMTLDKALTISGVITDVAKEIRDLVNSNQYNAARLQFIKYNHQARDSVKGKPYSVSSQTDFTTEACALQSTQISSDLF
jgi:hypothetical protein